MDAVELTLAEVQGTPITLHLERPLLSILATPHSPHTYLNAQNSHTYVCTYT